VQLVEVGAALPGEVASAFGVTYAPVRLWRRACSALGTEGLLPQKLGPQRPVKLTEEVRQKVQALAEKGTGLRAIAREVGLDPSTVRRALPKKPAAGATGGPGRELVPLATPEPRDEERALARSGLLTGAEPVITEGSSPPFAGALLVLPALAATGLLEAFSEVYDSGRAAFYSLRALVLTLAFTSLIGEPRAEGLRRLCPAGIGRLIGLDRAPEVGTLRRRMEELAKTGRSAELLRSLAKAHLQKTGDYGTFYIDGHARAYFGKSQLPKAHLARARLSGPAEVGTWLCDRTGQGVLVWGAEPGASLAGELKRAVAEIRALVGPGAAPTIVFDRGGWSPKLFTELVALGFDILTYKKGRSRPEPRKSFTEHDFVDDLGRAQYYWLAERPKRFGYKDGKADRFFSVRQVTRSGPKTGHQTQVVTTRDDLSAPEVAYWCFCPWRQENFFRYMRARLGLGALGSYAKLADDPERSVPDPKKKEAAKKVKQAKVSQAKAEALLAKAVSAGTDGSLAPSEANQAIAAATEPLAKAKDAVAKAKAAQGKVPARVALGELHADAVRQAPERKRAHDAIRTATYNATSSLAALLASHYRRAEDEARTLLLGAFCSPADMEVLGDELHVRLEPLSEPRRSRAITGLCEELNETRTIYPGTNLRLVYSVPARLAGKTLSRPLGSISPRDVQSLVNKWAHDRAPRTVSRQYDVLRAIFNYAVDGDLIGRSPCRNIQLPKSSAARRNVITNAQLAEAIGEQYALMVYVGAMLGLRWGKCAGLWVRDLDLLTRTVTIVGQRRRGKGGRMVEAAPKSVANRRTLTMSSRWSTCSLPTFPATGSARPTQTNMSLSAPVADRSSTVGSASGCGFRHAGGSDCPTSASTTSGGPTRRQWCGWA
jgi:integrase